MKFTLTIELGNEAMQTGYDVADALREIADRIYPRGLTEHRNAVSLVGLVRDINGNTVGSWQVTE